METRKLSFIVPVYNEHESVGKLYEEIMDVVRENEYKYEIWFVNDGSSDGSLKLLRELAAKDNNVSVVSFRSNFGKAAALQSGFYHCTGDIVITMDADLQDDPKEVPRFLEKIDEGFDVVSGWKKTRHDPLEKRLPSKLFNKVTSSMSGVKLHDFNCGFKAYKKEVVKSIDLYGELHRYIPVLAKKKGFSITEIAVEHHARKFGKSKYGITRYLRGLFDSLTTSFLLKYSDRPMHFFGKAGLAFFVIGLAICILVTVQKFAFGMPLTTRPLLTLGILLLILGGMFFAIGFIGEMIVSMMFRMRYNESHVKEIINGEEE